MPCAEIRRMAFSSLDFVSQIHYNVMYDKIYFPFGRCILDVIFDQISERKIKK